MSNFLNFLERVVQHCVNKSRCSDVFRGENEYELAANVLNEINRFLYQKRQLYLSEYISEFRIKYWEENHEKVLHPKVNPANGECLAAAKVWRAFIRAILIKVQLDTLDLTKEEIARVLN